MKQIKKRSVSKKRIINRPCHLCIAGMKDISYREVELLGKFLSSFLKIQPRRRSGLCALHQRKVAKAIKRAREMGLLSYVPM